MPFACCLCRPFLAAARRPVAGVHVRTDVLRMTPQRLQCEPWLSWADNKSQEWPLAASLCLTPSLCNPSSISPPSNTCFSSHCCLLLLISAWFLFFLTQVSFFFLLFLVLFSCLVFTTIVNGIFIILFNVAQMFAASAFAIAPSRRRPRPFISYSFIFFSGAPLLAVCFSLQLN